ncbi:MAG TPA: NHL repeat-containing protein [Solirubrobacterales bacterium]|nr:NHL repeat-containing protein [Solirubrobacterales bacterium]
MAVTLALCAMGPVGASAAVPDRLWDACETGSGAGQCRVPYGIAADPTTGHLFIADVGNNRIDELTVWGVSVKSWGWGVRDGSEELQTCTAETGCLSGHDGAGDGQLNQPLGVVVDGAGDVYVLDRKNHDIQKFDPTSGPGEDEAEFLLAFGGEVNKTKSEEVGSTEAERNLCAAASGDVCQAGTTGTGAGQFGPWSAFGIPIALGAGNEVYVGDEGRIQRFDAGGHYLESIPLPGEKVQSLAIDTSGGANDGDLYVARCNPATSCVAGTPERPASKPDVLKLSPAGDALGTLAILEPLALAVDEVGDVYAVGENKFSAGSSVKIHKFGPAGNELPGFPFSDGFDLSMGLATGSACGIVGADLYVSNSAGLSGSSYVRAYGPPPDPTLCPPPKVPPKIAAQYATSVQSSGATLKADISTEFWPDTTYYVQYGTGKCSAGGCDREQPVAPGSKLNLVTNRPVATAGVFLGNLEPGTTYHYRFVAESSGGGPVFGVGGEVGADGAEGAFTTFPVPSEPKTDCPNQAFRTEASARLPDCRAYEMVSPLDKNGGDVIAGEVARGFTSPRKSSADGNRLAFSSLRPFLDPSAAPLTNQYLSARGSDGWSSSAISPPRSVPLWAVGFTGQFKAFDDDLCEGWLLQDTALALVPGAPSGVANAYTRDYCDPAAGYQLLTTEQPPGVGFGPGETRPETALPNMQAASADGAHTAIMAGAMLTPDACPTAGMEQVYLTSPDAPLRLVSALPNGHATCTHSNAGSFEDFGDGFTGSNMVGAVSADGSRVFWTDTLSAATGEGLTGGPGNLYLRLNATEEQSPVQFGSCAEPELACTVAISKSGEARFWAANPQGATAIYTVGSVQTGKAELFEYDAEAAESKSIAKGVSGVAGVSEDASRVYFISTEALSGGQENSEGDKAQAGAPNLYLSEAGVGIVFVARLSSFDTGVGDFKPSSRHSRISPDGLHLAFASEARLTDYDNTELSGGGPAQEVYLYDAGGSGGPGELHCVSCNPSGARPRGRETVGNNSRPRTWSAATIPGWSEQRSPTRLLSADGSRFFFESYDGLIPRDSNGRTDVYEWQKAAGEAACDEAGADLYAPSAGGCISLISSGQSPADSELIDVGKSGRDVFFTTSSSLLPQDPGLIDVYDARAGGGFPPPAKPAAICEGDACQGPVSAPSDPTPASAAFEGAGNVKQGGSSRCPKGKRKARKGGRARCVARKPGKRPNQADHRPAHHKRANNERRAGR